MKISSKTLNTIIRFSKKHPWDSPWSPRMIKRFVEEHISSENKILSLYQKNTLVASFILLDKIKNKGGFSHFEVLGIKNKKSAPKHIEQALLKFKTTLPSHHKGTLIGLNKKYTFIKKLNLKLYYQSYKMVTKPKKSLNKNLDFLELSKAKPEDLKSIYSLLIRAFKNNKDIAYSNYTQWKRHQKFNQTQVTLLLKNKKNLLDLFVMKSIKIKKAKFKPLLFLSPIKIKATENYCYKQP